MVVTSCRLLYGSDEPITQTHVLEVEANEGSEDSWESEPRWVGLSELSSNINLAHRPVRTMLRQSLVNPRFSARRLLRIPRLKTDK